MAETNDRTAHFRALRLEPNSQPMLNGQVYSLEFQRNQQYQIPQTTWGAIALDLAHGNTDSLVKLCSWYVNDHYVWQNPRILRLKRYYNGDDDIHYWLSNKQKRADNRISCTLAEYITDYSVGYQFGNDLQFGYDDGTDDAADDSGDTVLNNIKDFNQQNDEPYHEKTMGKELNNTGRAFELLYVPKDSTSPRIKAIPADQCFVIYNTDIEKCPLVAVRYYAVNVMDSITFQVEVYTDKNIYYFSTGGDPATDWKLNQTVQHYFNGVPIIEIDYNEDRIGKWETQLDKIDAMDKSLSEMANSQEDFSNATLVISGDITDPKTSFLKDPDGNILYIDSETGEYTTKQYSNEDEQGNPIQNKYAIVDRTPTTNANVLQLRPSYHTDNNGVTTSQPTTVEYLTKQLDGQEWQSYVQTLLTSILRNVNVPDFSDDNFAGNASGVAMSYKLLGSDQSRVIMETLYKRGITHRLRLLCNYWSYLRGSGINFETSNQEDNPANNVTVKFTPNLPKNEAEIIQNLLNLHNTGEFSQQTFLDLASQVTGVPASQEIERLKSEAADSSNDSTADLANMYAKLNGMNQSPASTSTDDGDDDDEDDGNGDSDDSNDTDDGQNNGDD